MRLSLPVLLRMHFIDTMLLCYGWLDRGPVMVYYGIAAAQATRDLAMYRKLAPGNTVYDVGTKRYNKAEGYKPLQYDVRQHTLKN